MEFKFLTKREQVKTTSIVYNVASNSRSRLPSIVTPKDAQRESDTFFSNNSFLFAPMPKFHWRTAVPYSRADRVVIVRRKGKPHPCGFCIVANITKNEVLRYPLSKYEWAYFPDDVIND